MLRDHLMLALIWLLWCGVHSLFITPDARDLAQRLLRGKYRYYRLGYSLFSLATLVPVILFERSLKSPTLLDWSGGFAFLRWPVLALAFVISLAASLRYDMAGLFGVRALFRKGSAARDELITDGVLSVVRHPLYLSGIIIVWTLRPLNAARAVTALVLTLYFLGGSLLEEAKLFKTFGREYADYAQRVPRFNPLPWLRGRLHRP